MMWFYTFPLVLMVSAMPALSQPVSLSIVRDLDGQPVLCSEGNEVGQWYRLEESSDVQNWQTRSEMVADSTNLFFAITNESSGRFYRMQEIERGVRFPEWLPFTEYKLVLGFRPLQQGLDFTVTGWGDGQLFATLSGSVAQYDDETGTVWIYDGNADSSMSYPYKEFSLELILRDPTTGFSITNILKKHVRHREHVGGLSNTNRIGLTIQQYGIYSQPGFDDAAATYMDQIMQLQRRVRPQTDLRGMLLNETSHCVKVITSNDWNDLKSWLVTDRPFYSNEVQQVATHVHYFGKAGSANIGNSSTSIQNGQQISHRMLLANARLTNVPVYLALDGCATASGPLLRAFTGYDRKNEQKYPLYFFNMGLWDRFAWGWNADKVCLPFEQLDQAHFDFVLDFYRWAVEWDPMYHWSVFNFQESYTRARYPDGKPENHAAEGFDYVGGFTARYDL